MPRPVTPKGSNNGGGVKKGSQASKDGYKLPKPQSSKKRKPPKKVLCGAAKRGGGKCNFIAGWGTNHVGIGKCKLHAGSTPNGIKAAATDEYRRLMGTPMEINPLDALMMCIKIRSGEIKWLGDRIAELDKKNWIEDTMVGKQFHLYVRERNAAMRDLAKYAQMAISLGIAERAVKMAETYGELLATYTQGILNDLWPHITPKGREEAPMIVRRHLLALDGGRKAPLAELPQTSEVAA